MPGSAVEGKDMVREFCIQNEVRTILDIGPGEGTYATAFQGMPLDRLDGIEVWAPYVNQFNLTQSYNNIYIADVCYFNWDEADNYDMIIFGDVFEHILEPWGLKVLEKAIEHAKWIVISLPIYGYAQGTSFDGNWFEAHLEQYTHDRMLHIIEKFNLTLLESMQGQILGVYICGVAQR